MIPPAVADWGKWLMQKINKPSLPPELASFAKALRAIDCTPITGTPVNPHAEFRFIVGSKDFILKDKKVIASCGELPYNISATSAQGCEHTPCYPDCSYNGVGQGMVDALAAIIHKWRK